MRVLIAPDSFSGTMTAVEAAEAIGHGWREVRPDDELLVVPMSDGGQGLLDVVAVAHPHARRHDTTVADAAGLARTAAWLELADGTAVVETARAIGLHDLSPERRDPLRTTTYGVGMLLEAVAASGAGRMVVGLGGSATVDGGAGMLSAVTGHALRRADGNAVKVGGRWVAQTVAVRPRERPAWPPVVIASDVTSPLLGPAGAARVFGPQKGADADAVAELEAALAILADVVERDLTGGPWRDRPGAGAAGGLGFALMALLDADCEPGAAVVADLVGLNTAAADVVVTGEGSLDATSGEGKVPGYLAARGHADGARALAVVGRVSPGDGTGGAATFDDVEDLGAEGPRDPHGSARRAAAALAARLV